MGMLLATESVATLLPTLRGGRLAMAQTTNALEARAKASMGTTRARKKTDSTGLRPRPLARLNRSLSEEDEDEDEAVALLLLSLSVTSDIAAAGGAATAAAPQPLTVPTLALFLVIKSSELTPRKSFKGSGGTTSVPLWAICIVEFFFLATLWQQVRFRQYYVAFFFLVGNGGVSSQLLRPLWVLVRI